MHNFNYNYSLCKSPCEYCGKRVIGCHSKCHLYNHFKAKLDKHNQTKHKIKAGEDNFMGHVSEVHRKRRKRLKVK